MAVEGAVGMAAAVVEAMAVVMVSPSHRLVRKPTTQLLCWLPNTGCRIYMFH